MTLPILRANELGNLGFTEILQEEFLGKSAHKHKNDIVAEIRAIAKVR